MIRVKVDPLNPDPAIVREAVSVLRAGGILIYPTDTLYGLGIDVTNEQAAARLFDLKGRPAAQPVSLLTDSLESIEGYNGLLPVALHNSLMRLLPGPYTVLLANKIKPEIHLYKRLKEQPRLGWRVPQSVLCRELSLKFGKPISTTSANITGQGNVKEVSELIAAFGEKPDMLLDAGPMKKTLGSTIVDFTKKPPLVVREGEVRLQTVREKLDDAHVVLKQNKFEIVFVCSGNICRSPMAEGLLKTMLAKTRYRQLIKISSAGTLNLPPSPVNHYADKVAAANGVTISSHISRPINQDIVERAGLIISLAVNHHHYLQKHFPLHREKFVLLKHWHRAQIMANPSIPDPIGHPIQTFEKTFTQIHSELKRVFPFIFAEFKKFARYHELIF